MNTIDKKQEILQKIKSTTDENLIEEVYELLHQNKYYQEVQLKNLPVELQNKINKAFDDYRSGKYITHEQMKKKVDQWLIQ